MKKFFLLTALLAFPIILGACEKGSNVNVTTIDLTNTAVVNTNVANTNGANVNGAVNTNAAANTNAPAATGSAVTVTASGFSPSTLTVKAGTNVTWTNNSGDTIRIASDPHPTHTDLPGLDSATLNNGDKYSFTFTQVGSWGYHDHFSPTTRGTIIVQ
ncbi:MAG: cupredoxin domain-containing protein [Patescibacteria group bacterium]